jgi:transcription-repair coupling factor (superfamily II helicase)
VELEMEADALAAEMRDRYGEPPAAVEHLLQIAKLKLRAVTAGVAEVGPEDGRLVVRLVPSARLNDREMNAFRGLLQPTLRQARQGYRSELPRANVATQGLSFAPGGQSQEFILKGVEHLIKLLQQRADHVRAQAEKAAAK